MSVGRTGERGAALLSVLLLVAVMAVIAAVMLDRMNLAARLAGNGQAMLQARLYSASAERIATARIGQLVAANKNRTVDPAGMLGRDTPLPLARGTVIARIEDGGNCFNVNSLVAGSAEQLSFRPSAQTQLRALMLSLEIPENEAIPLSDAMVDWIDTDNQPQINGAEDSAYAGVAVPYRTAGRLIVDLSELRAVKGMSPQIFTRLRPWLCALPPAELSPINVNTLRPEQARLIAMLAPQAVPVDRAQQLIMARPPQGVAAVADFLKPMTGGNATLFGPEAIGQLQTRSRWFLVRTQTRVDSLELEEEFLVDTSGTSARVVARSFGEQ